MILGATHSEILAFFIVFCIAIALGIGYIALFFLRLATKSAVLRFIYDFVYAIIVGGIFVLTMLSINMCDVKYYHVLALILGIFLSGYLPTNALKSREKAFIAYFERVKSHISKSKLYRIIKK